MHEYADSQGSTVVQWLAPSSHSRKVLGSNLLASWGFSVLSLHTMCVKASVNGCSFLCVRPVIE